MQVQQREKLSPTAHGTPHLHAPLRSHDAGRNRALALHVPGIVPPKARPARAPGMLAAALTSRIATAAASPVIAACPSPFPPPNNAGGSNA